LAGTIEEVPPTPDISVIIPAYRAQETIGRALIALREQQAAPRFEVIVVDSSPDLATVAAASAALGDRAAGATPPHRIERLPERAHPGTARNHGAALASAPILLFLDADSVAAPDLLAETARALAADVDVAGGSIALSRPTSISAHLRHLLQFKESLPELPGRSSWMLPSACVAYRRSVFAKHGGFPDTRASEDWLLHWRMWRSGERMAFEPRMAIVHLTPSGWSDLARYSRLLGFHSGVARRSVDLPGQAVVRWPLLAIFLPFARTLRALVWCARNAPRELGFLVFTWPAYLAIATLWSVGFASGLRSPPAARNMLARDLRL
jgi:cellulose synthase/poly-beta-1,6-N-acetylglucosamine synthase-like glycosyltransferase